jgi:hypothetical protein
MGINMASWFSLLGHEFFGSIYVSTSYKNKNKNKNRTHLKLVKKN